MESIFNLALASLAGSDTPATDNPLLQRYWSEPVAELLAFRGDDAASITAEQQERHRIYAGALAALVWFYWNGNKNGRAGSYPMNPPVSSAGGSFLDSDYLGHNIAGLAVDGSGRILDFDFNHNRAFNSSAEHAEARLIRRVFALAQLSDTWGGATDAQLEPATDYTTLSDVTVYTSLESCAQCSGVMALGRVKAVVYLQTDPGTYLIGRILRNLTDPQLRAPLPIPASLIGFSQFSTLDTAYKGFFHRPAGEPFWIGPDGKTDETKSVTSFLCTAVARDTFGDAKSDFDRIDDDVALEHPAYRPTQSSLSNTEVLAEARQFLDYACHEGRRGTPHH
jgi:tRNA(Arg) A34 adenosine deaminase TadA